MVCGIISWDGSRTGRLFPEETFSLNIARNSIESWTWLGTESTESTEIWLSPMRSLDLKQIKTKIQLRCSLKWRILHIMLSIGLQRFEWLANEAKTSCNLCKLNEDGIPPQSQVPRIASPHLSYPIIANAICRTFISYSLVTRYPWYSCQSP